MSVNEIELEQICFRIGTFEMSDLTLSIRKGEYFVLTGHNGSGKTLLIKMITGLYRPENGTIRLMGAIINDLSPWKRNIGYVPQEGLLFPDRSVRGNIRFGQEVRRVGEKQITESVDRVARLLNIVHLLDRPVVGLSGGERQRVALARALAFEPRVLLLDEPVSAIDENSRDELCSELRRIQCTLGITVLHVAHAQREIDLVADRVGQIKAGGLQNIIALDRK
ncbi:MAG: ATP-binding cassette domain-containing protein [Kiritimatiellae bacterium]|nr:ATP-binding cassette domain-containing protein [Kiritimatiellia bacterium]MDD5523009.1 ATP-binding cassette domain-containing protein [Kiritimatiellia bacterium]